ncbi:ribose-5-phosphate isomerase RpiA [Dinghuibacter silviterrae]|uniref:Ribose-5-phosphate isomerase A n=1 Tax=Dinghuibacter silviterrae TaxID=1539049 RepID=A0A4R8DSE1_9BACT|nr:ribose-5-phosphate isomerase RpiA [Dinghuibacter silviterrae]TDX01174.1 ribose-5-phosphate isomerase [Dinghuibacter silviterrae]
MTALSDKDQMKKKVGEYAATFIQNGTAIGIGTGSTAYWMIMALGAKVREGFQITAVPTSRATVELAQAQGIPLATLNDVDRLALTIDGADEVDPAFQLIKGGGGAHLQEKMVAAASDRMIVIADEQKLVNRLGKFPLPIEVIPFGWKQVQRRVAALGCPSSEIRQRDGKPWITDHGNYILDAHFGAIADAPALGHALHEIPGVVEHGLFIGLATEVLVGYADGTVKELRK